jgi:hypothetical protein
VRTRFRLVEIRKSLSAILTIASAFDVWIITVGAFHGD